VKQSQAEQEGYGRCECGAHFGRYGRFTDVCWNCGAKLESKPDPVPSGQLVMESNPQLQMETNV